MNISSSFRCNQRKKDGFVHESTFDYVSTVTDMKQKKVLHKMMDIIMPVFFSMIANADDWVVA